MKLNRNGEVKNEFYGLDIEFSKINSLVLNWTVVHPINENSPLYGLSLEELKNYRAEVLVYLKAYDEVFANTVIARTSYTSDEIIDGAKFKPMYEPSTTGTSTVLYIDQLNDYEMVNIEKLRPVLSE